MLLYHRVMKEPHEPYDHSKATDRQIMEAKRQKHLLELFLRKEELQQIVFGNISPPRVTREIQNPLELRKTKRSL